MAYEKIIKTVSICVPRLEIENKLDKEYELRKFEHACNLAKRCIADNEEEILVVILGTRLSGKTLELIKKGNIIKDFINIIKNKYLPTKPLDELMFDLKNIYQQSIEELVLRRLILQPN